MFDVTFSPPEAQGIILVTLSFNGNPAELVFDGTGFTAAYAGGSTRTPITDGYQFKLYRSGGWPTQPVISVQGVNVELEDMTARLNKLEQFLPTADFYGEITNAVGGDGVHTAVWTLPDSFGFQLKQADTAEPVGYLGFAAANALVTGKNAGAFEFTFGKGFIDGTDSGGGMIWNMTAPGAVPHGQQGNYWVIKGPGGAILMDSGPIGYPNILYWRDQFTVGYRLIVTDGDIVLNAATDADSSLFVELPLATLYGFRIDLGGQIKFQVKDNAITVGSDSSDICTFSGPCVIPSLTGTSLVGAITNARLADVSTSTIKGRVAAGTGAPTDLTGTQATTLLDIATTSLKGLMSAADKVLADALNAVVSIVSGNAQVSVATGKALNVLVNAVNAIQITRGDPFSFASPGPVLDFSVAGDSFAYIKASSSLAIRASTGVQIRDVANTTQFQTGTGATFLGSGIADKIVFFGVPHIPVFAAASVPTPAAGYYATFYDSSNGDKLTRKKSDGTTALVTA